MFGGSYESAIAQLRDIVDSGSITDGKNGAIAFSQNQTKKIEALNKNDVSDTTGAGDFYAAGYIFGQLMTSNLDISLELGSMLAANAIKQIGASPNADIVDEIFSKYPKFFVQ